MRGAVAFLVAAVSVAVAAVGVSSSALPYPSEDGVVVVTDANFKQVVDSHRTVLLEFYAPWCGHCKALVPEFAAVARFIHKAQQDDGALTSVVAKCDATASRALAMAHSVASYPSLLLFQRGELVEKYTGERNFEDIMEYVKDMDASCAAEDGSGGGGAAATPSLATSARAARSFRYAPRDLVDSGFVQVLDSTDGLASGDARPWLLAVFKNGCGHCRRMEADWLAALRALHADTALADKVRVGVIDAEGMDRDAPLMQLLPGFRGTPAFFSYIPPAASATGAAVSANFVTASRASDMVFALARRLAAGFFLAADSVAEVDQLARQQSLRVSHDLTFVLVTAGDDVAAAQVRAFRQLAGELATGVFAHVSGVEAAQHFNVAVSATASAVVALDSRGRQLAGHATVSHAAGPGVFAASGGVAGWIKFKVATAFQWMSPVNQGNFFEGIKALDAHSREGWSDDDAAAKFTSGATVMLADFPDAAYRDIVDDARAAHPDVVFYFQLGGFLQRRFLYGLHCPDVATTPCVNVHPLDSPFADVLRLSKLLEGPDAARYTGDQRSSLLNILDDFKAGRVRRESFNVMDNIKAFGKVKAMALERGEDPNGPLDASKYPPLSGPIPGDVGSKPPPASNRPKPQKDKPAVDAARARKLDRKTKLDADQKAMPKPKPKPKGSAGQKKQGSAAATATGSSGTKQRMERRLQELEEAVRAMRRELADMDDGEWE